MKKLLALILTLAMVLSVLPGTVAAAGSNDSQPVSPELEAELREALFSADGGQLAEPEACDPDEIVRVIVEMSSAPALELASAASVQALNAETEALRGQEAAISAVRQELNLEPVHRTGYLVSTVSYDIRRGDIERLRSVPGVVSVTEALKYEPEMFSAKEMTGVYEAWELGTTGYTGKGMSIAVIDTGVNWLHQDMVQDAAAAKHTQAEMEELIAELGHGQWFSDKVPYGHSYVAGHDEIVNDVNNHGHHVAGIAAAGGDESENHISGVAPDAQIFAMQVFDPITGVGGYSDDIICAIEDAVKLNADVINMSLGSDSGFYGYDRYLDYAVDRAQEAGVFVAVSAGNAGTSTDKSKSYDEIVTNDWELADVAMVASPSTAAGAASVASVDSYGYLTYRFSVTPAGAETRAIDCIRLSKGQFETDSALFIDCGTGSYSELYGQSENAAGNVALARYDAATANDYTLSNMVYYAEYAGFSGIIILSDYETLPREISFQSSTYYNVPAAFVTAGDSAYFTELSAAGTAVSLSAYDEGFYFNTEDGHDATSSFFSSWGPTPTLEIKPELAAPGGTVLSTGNGSGSYLWMSGTSMASPFVAGAGALVKQYVQEANLDVGNVPEFIRRTLMNTAVPVYDANGKMASVRQVGAGMVNLEKAVQNTVVATYNGKAAIELGDNLSTTAGEILLTNYGSEDVTYSLSASTVCTDYTDPTTKEYGLTALSGAYVTFDADSVDVPAGGTASASFTLNIYYPYTGHYAEGYIYFGSEDAPSLSLPFLGFMGSWSDEAIIDAPAWEEDAVLRPITTGYYGITQHGTGLLTSVNGTAAMLGEVYSEYKNEYGWLTGKASIDPEKIAFSPDGDGVYDVIIPWLGMLRNAAEVSMEVLDSTGAVIAVPGTAFNMRKITAESYTSSNVAGRIMSNGDYNVGWDGTVYDQSTGDYTVVDEGDYTVRLSASLYDGAPEQTVELPVSVDFTAPVISNYNITRSGHYYTVSFKAESDDLHYEFALALNDNVSAQTLVRATYDEATGYYSGKYYIYTAIPSSEVIHTALMVKDYAGNTAVAYKTINADAETDECGLTNLSFDSVNYIRAAGAVTDLRVFGFAPEGSTVTLNGIEAETDGTDFTAIVPLTLGENTVDVLILDAEGTELLSDRADVYVATDFCSVFSVPVVGGDFRATAINTGWVLMLDQDYEDGTVVPVSARIADPENMTVICGGAAVTPDEEGHVSFEVTLSGGTAKYYIMIKNVFGDSYYIQSLICTPTAAEQALQNGQLSSMDPVYSPEVWYSSGFTGVTPDMLREDGTYELRGHVYNPVDRLLINGTEVEVRDDLTWSCGVELRPGVNNVSVVAEKDGVNYPASTQKIVYETEGPELTLELPAPRNGKYYVDTPDFLLKGTVTTRLDDAEVYVNDTVILGSNNIGHIYQEDSVTREFSYPLTLGVGDNYVTVTAYNYLGLYTEIPLILVYGVEPPACGHEHTETVTVPATCTEPGSETVVCSDCGETVSVKELPTLGHDFSVKGETVEPTETENGYTVYKCSRCDATEHRDFVPALGQRVVDPAPAPGHICASEPFTDLDIEQWYHEYTDYVIEKGIMQGVDDSRFDPDGTTTRAMLVTTLYRLAGEPTVTEPSGFTDVNAGEWYARAVAWAQDLGIAEGVTDTEFCPDAAVTREQAAAFLFRFVTLYLHRESAEGAVLSVYSDAGTVSDYAGEAIAWATAVGLFDGFEDGTLRPADTLTRVQLAKLLTVLDRKF